MHQGKCAARPEQLSAARECYLSWTGRKEEMRCPEVSLGSGAGVLTASREGEIWGLLREWYTGISNFRKEEVSRCCQSPEGEPGKKVDEMESR